jgi:hypothetical protein
MPQADSRRPFKAEARVRFRSIHVEFVMDSVVLAEAFLRDLRFLPVNIIPSCMALHAHVSSGV